MIKIVCDRCGKTITEDEEIGYIAWNFRESIRGDLVHENEFEGKHYCPDCMDEIHAFISGGEVPSVMDEDEKADVDIAEDDPHINMPQIEIPPKRSRKKIDIGKIMALREAGWSNAKIADEMGMTSTAVAQAVYMYKRKHERNEEQ